ncbi:protein transport protein Sec31A isoform X7 [Xiphophorus couchianus]|uniref:protein transport protein Sec31A isoform X7 n=1 Tax=Xiphophorus couchianus TaxID=32473 RepID=UPI00101711AD|nr:protein transport protein Sec31A isoform X7 [Xiphophorus couchianus]
MKLKEINRTAIQSWSPAQHHPIYLATGTSAQQLDASFSTNASLELFELDLADPSLDMKSCGSLSSAHRYHKLVWGPYGMDAQGHPSGVLIAGGENGNVILYDAAKIVAGESDVIVAESVRHTGPVRALDVNHFQSNLVASGGNESEIYIWDMNNFGSPMTPGPKAQPQEDISCVAWNKQVHHILASACPSGRASVWDLRKNDLIIKVSDHSNRMHCSGLAWNPEVATQLVLASEDDRLPVIQMWDLRFASSPLKILEHHTRGVLAIAWSLADPELLLSCGKDSRILCWNPNTGEVLYELPTGSQWCFDIQWCPRNPAVLSAAGFDGHIDIYSIMGGSSQAQSQRHADQISNSFGNLDPFGTGPPLPPLQLPQTPATPATVNPLKKPPKWIRRPVGASFAFGGKLVSLENARPPQPQQPTSHVVHVSQVVTETAFLERSDRLQATLSSGGFVDFCQEKISAAGNEFERTVWSFLKVNFESDVRSKYLELLGYNKEEVASKISAALEEKPANVPQPDLSASASPLPPADLSLAPPADTPEAAFDLIAASNLQPAAALQLNSTPDPDSEEPAEPEDGPDSELDTNMVEEEEEEEKQEEEDEIPLNEDLIAQVEVEESSPIETPAEIPPPVPTPAGGVHLSVSQDVDGLITQALLTGDFQGAVELCLHDNRMADSIILAIAGGADLLEKTQRKYFTKANSKITKLISAVVMKDWHDILKTCDLQNWREAMAAVMTYARPEEFSSLCDLLGSRLEAAEDPQLQSQACLCYICAGNVEKLVSCWSRAQDGHCPLSLQDLVEKVVVLRRAVELTQHSGPAAIGILLAEKMSQYASLLASQGGLSTAITYLPDNTNQVAVQQLRDRLIWALGQQAAPAQTHRESQLPGRPALPQHPFPQVQPALVPQPAAGVPAPGPTPASAPSQLQYYQPVKAASTVTSWSNQTPTALPNVPPPPHVGSTPDQQVEPPNPMYGLPASSTPAAPSASSTPGYMYSHQYQRPQNGWNDPPALTRAPKKKVPQNYTPPAPITAPILAPPGADPQAQPMSTGGPQDVLQGLQGPQGPYSGMHQTQLPSQSINASMPNSNMEGAPGAPTGDAIQPLQSIPAEKIMKKPIPDEHLVLKTTFEGLIQKCLAVAADPQTKRKLDDANKRLEALYDKLREQTLSPAIIGGLHSIARTIESRSYAEGLNIHTHIVGSSNFSETSAFMPVLKVVLTQANKLGV